MALPVGAASLAEYMDVSMEEAVPAEEIVSRLDAAMPAGWKITGAWELEDTDPSLMSLVDASGWRIALPLDMEETREAVKGLLAADSCPVVHNTPRGERVKDIRPGILELEAEPAGEFSAVTALLAAGSRANISPYLLARALAGEEGQERAGILRTELYHRTKGGRLVPFRALAEPF